MLETREMLTEAKTDRCNQLTSGVLILAEKELSAFVRAIDRLFGATRRANRRGTGSRNWDVWIGHLGNRLQIGVGLRWAQVLDLALRCLAVDIAALQIWDQCVRHVQEQLQSNARID